MCAARQFLKQWAIGTVCWTPVAIYFVDHGYSIGQVRGRSMQPTLNPDSNMLKNDLVLQNRWVVTTTNYRIGDVVTLTSPVDPGRKITKRIIALEGDIVQTRPPYPEPTIRIPRGHCWIEGDEGFHSRDSNFYGPVPLGLLKERIEWVIYPFDRFGRVERKTKDARVRYAPGHGSYMSE